MKNYNLIKTRIGISNELKTMCDNNDSPVSEFDFDQLINQLFSLCVKAIKRYWLIWIMLTPSLGLSHTDL